jgi:hypothetical protein
MQPCAPEPLTIMKHIAEQFVLPLCETSPDTNAVHRPVKRTQLSKVVLEPKEAFKTEEIQANGQGGQGCRGANQCCGQIAAGEPEVVDGEAEGNVGISRASSAPARRHPLEEKWGTNWWTILDAIAASPDLSQRGVRGLLAEHEFYNRVLANMTLPWIGSRAVEKKHGEGTGSIDWLLTKGEHTVTIQVKMQRFSKGVVVIDEKGQGLVETQKTRTRGNNKERRYEYGEFDILAVSLWPSTQDWTRFMYIPDFCLPHAKGKRNLIAAFHPVPLKVISHYYWTDSLEEAFEYVIQRRKPLTPDGHCGVIEVVKDVAH